MNDRTALEYMLMVISGKFSRLKKLWADMGYQGQIMTKTAANLGFDLEIVRRPPKRFWVPNEVKDVAAYLRSIGVEVVEGFKVLPKRWIVERTFTWMKHYRRMSKDYEFLCSTEETMMNLAMIRTMLKRAVKLIKQI